MKAKVKPDVALLTVTAFAGREYYHDHWESVPVGKEQEALAHPMLEVDLELLEAKPVELFPDLPDVKPEQGTIEIEQIEPIAEPESDQVSHLPPAEPVRPRRRRTS